MRLAVAARAFAFVFALCANARADGPGAPRVATADVATQAQELLDNGISLFKAGDLERARVALERASALVPGKPNPYRWLGLVEARLGHCTGAVAAFDEFLARVPMGDPRTVEVVTLRERCRAELAPKLGTLTVASTPPGAEVRLRAAGEPLLGRTPLAATDLPAGSHVVVVRKPGYLELARGVTVAEHEAVRLDLVLEAAPSRRRPYWIIGAVLGPLAAVGLGVGLGVGLTRGDDRRTLPPIGATP